MSSREVEKVVLATYSLQLIGPSLPFLPLSGQFLGRALLAEAEENLTDLLPPGYSAIIREWDDEQADVSKRLWFVTLLDKGQEITVEVHANTKPGARGRAKELHPFSHIVHVEQSKEKPA